MKIAILSWGSLITTGTSRGLQAGPFIKNGPRLPIEFSRISKSRNGILTAVIDEQHGTFNQTHSALSTLTNLNHALKNLRETESATNLGTTGYVNLKFDTQRDHALNHHPISTNIIRNWAENQYDAVIWTALLTNFTNFNTQNAINYLNTLPDLNEALDYIRGMDLQTSLRNALLL